MLKPVCVKCNLFYRPEINGQAVLENMPNPSYHTSSPANEAGWYPYKLWIGDRWKCRGCGSEIVIGFTGGPISEHYLPNFKATVERARTIRGGLVEVDDC